MSKKTKTETGPSKFAQPFIRQGANALSNAYGQAQGAVQQQTDSVLGMLNPFLADRMQNGDAGVNAAKSYGADVLAGRYLDSNPYLDQVVGDTNDDIRNQLQASLGAKGLTGGSSYADIISRNIAKNSAAMRYGDYNAERGRMDAAAGRAGSLAGADYLPVQGLLSTISASKAPFDLATQYAGGLGGLLGGYQAQKGSDGGKAMGDLAQTAAMMFMMSDERLKTDIKKVGKTDDGLPVYTYRYGGEGPHHMGVMAQDVAKKQPKALGPEVGGYMSVNYKGVR